MDDDSDIIYFFKHFEEILNQDASVESRSKGYDYQVFREYLIEDTKEIQQKIDKADDTYLLYICEHIYNIVDWLNLIIANTSDVFGAVLYGIFDEKFGDIYILQSLYNKALNKWIIGKNGQHVLGANTYSVLNENLYYRDRFGQWYLVDRKTAFDVKPGKEEVDGSSVMGRLESEYTSTIYDDIIKNWQNQKYSGILQDDFMRFDKDVTSPEEYFDFTMQHIQKLLKEPVSISEIERWYGGRVEDLEDSIKLCTIALEIVKKRRKDDSHTIYLLRDCLVFYEIHKTLDALDSKTTSSDQLLVGRKLLSQTPEKWGYYIATLEALYKAHILYPHNFEDFYNEYSRLLNIFAKENSNFNSVLKNLAAYIEKHALTTEDRITVFDVGFQGSINLLVKYIIDHHIHGTRKRATDIQVSVGAQWSKDLFGDRIMGDYFPFLNRVQFMATNDELYHYVFGSLKSGGVKVKMGDKSWQRKAAAELVVLVTVCLLSKKSAE